MHIHFSDLSPAGGAAKRMKFDLAVDVMMVSKGKGKGRGLGDAKVSVRKRGRERWCVSGRVLFGEMGSVG